jgi:hypothetical protein
MSQLHSKLNGMPRKLAGLIKVCLNVTYNTVRIGENLSDKFPIQNDLKQGPLFFTLLLEYVLAGSK